MKPIRLIAFIVALSAFSCDTERNVAPVFETFFTKYYGSDGNQTAVDFVVNSDGSMVILANTTSQISTDPRPCLVKIDKTGEVLWQRQTGQLKERATDIESDGNGGLLVVSNIIDQNDTTTGGVSQIRVLHLDQSGKGIDSVEIDNRNGDGVQVSQTAISINRIVDGTFLVSGSAGAEYVKDLTLVAGPDLADELAYRIDLSKFQSPEKLANQGGEHIGQFVRGFQSLQAGPKAYLFFGDSDRPFQVGGAYRRSFEIYATDQYGTPNGQSAQTGVVDGESQVASAAIETPGLSQESYLVIGTSTIGTSSTMLIMQYVINGLESANGVVIRVNKKFDFAPRMEGTAAAISPFGDMYLLGNVIQDNNKRDVILVKANSDGNNPTYKSFGAIDGDDIAAGVKVLDDGRIAVVATIELETQKKIALFVLSPDGGFVQ